MRKRKAKPRKDKLKGVVKHSKRTGFQPEHKRKKKDAV